MTPREYVDIARERWRVIVACLLIGLVAAGAAAVVVPPGYSAAITVIATPQQSNPLVPATGSDELSTQRISTYVELMHSTRLAGAVVGVLRLPVTAAQLADRIDVTTTPNSSLITATVTDGSPVQAVKIANSLGDQFVINVAQIEQPSDPTLRPPVVAKVFEAAGSPAQQVAPRPALYLAVGAVLGLLLGFVGALLRHALDTRVKGGRQLEDALGAPVLGTIGRDQRGRSGPLVRDGAPQTPLAEAFRRLRTNIRFVDVDRGHKMILLTSANPGDGRSTTACHLGLALAEAGTSVLVIDADLRNPSIARRLGIDDAPGLTDVLVDQESVDTAVRSVVPDLDALPSGPLPPNPSELLGSKRMTDLLEVLNDRYEVVLVDAPPLLPVTDAAVLAPRVDGVVVLARYGRTAAADLEAVAAALRTVSGRILGSVLTRVPHAGRTLGRRRRRPLARAARATPEPAVVAVPEEVPAEETAVGGTDGGTATGETGPDRTADGTRPARPRPSPKPRAATDDPLSRERSDAGEVLDRESAAR